MKSDPIDIKGLDKGPTLLYFSDLEVRSMPGIESTIVRTVILGTVLPWVVIIILIVAISAREGKPLADPKRFQVVVLGDIGRSPRMQYHALSLAKHGGMVDLIGYDDSALHPDILAAHNIVIRPLKPPPLFLKTEDRRLFLIYGPLKVLFQVWTLLLVLSFKTKHSGYILVQNPPSIPVLAVAHVVCFVRNSRLIIDWHNFGYSILALKLGKSSQLVRISKVYERVLSWNAYGHFCVTDAMAKQLVRGYGLTTPVIPLHDRPASIFQVLDPQQRSQFLQFLPQLGICEQTTVDSIKSGKTKVIVSSTSWTPDEDFSILLNALIEYSDRANQGESKTKILAVITGKGPKRATFEGQVRHHEQAGNLKRVIIKTTYLDDISDYAKLLGVADLGISLHTSSSGVDLPMKVVDMFGAGLPVAGWGDFEAWPELVTEGQNGRSFRDSRGLQKILTELFCGDPQPLKKLKAGAVKEGERRWDDEWDPIAGKLFGLTQTSTRTY